MPQSATATFERLADELYGRPRREFTGAREAFARTARAAGDAELAARLHRLPKPSAPAWLANLLVRERPEEVARLTELGGDLRTAQARFDGEALRRLSERRRRAVETLIADARRLAAAHGETVSGATLRELEATLEAASLDADAAAQVRAGRLNGALAYSGMGLLPSSGAPPEPRVVPAPDRRGSADTRGRERRPTTGGSGATRARREAHEDGRPAARAAAALASARRGAARARGAVAAAEAELARRRDALREAEQAHRRARAALDVAERAAARAEKKVAETATARE